MSLTAIESHPNRVQLANELHARPFSKATAPARLAHIAIERDPEDFGTDRAFLIDLLDRFGVSHPAPDANRHFADLGRAKLTWERHSEFVTFTLYADGLSDPPFSGELFDQFPPEWLAKAPGRLLTSALVRMEEVADRESATERLFAVAGDWFVREAMATSFVLDGAASVASDFHLDAQGNIRFAVFKIGDTGRHRMGRIVQRMLEIETYKSVSMLTLPVARQVFSKLGELERELSDAVSDMAAGDDSSQESLDRLLGISARIEELSAKTSYRFGAAEAYSALVRQRIEVLREQRLSGGQTLDEFMMRRFEPAMRTCRSASRRLADLSGRAARASRLLSTRVSVKANQQNQSLLAQMDKRAQQQIKLQQTVEGLSVFAISSYAVTLLVTLLRPFMEMTAVDPKWLGPALVVPVFYVVYRLVRRVSKAISA